MTIAFLACFPKHQRATVGGHFARAARAGATTPDALVAMVRARCLARDTDLDGGIVRDLDRHPQDARAYAVWMLWWTRLTPDERTAVEREWKKRFVMSAQMRKPASDNQRNLLISLGDTSPVSNAWDASQRIDARLPQGDPIYYPPPPAGLLHLPDERPTDPTRPTALPLIVAGVPTALREYRQWLCWRYERRGDKWTKPPFDPQTGRYASPTDPAAWVSFDEAVAAYTRGDFDGVGFVFTAGDEFAGVDLDDVRNPFDGTLTAEAAAIVHAFDTYTEASPSGTGVKSIFFGRLAGRGRKQGDYEVYDRGHFFTVTGHHLPDASPTIEARQAVLDTFCDRFFPPEPEPVAHPAPLERTPRSARQGMHSAPSLGETFVIADNGEAILAEVWPLLSTRIQGLAEGDDTVTKTDGTPYASASDRFEALLCALFRLGLNDQDAVTAALATPQGRFNATKRGSALFAWVAESCKSGREWLATQSATKGTRYIALDAAFLTHAPDIGSYGLAVAVALASHAPRIHPSQERIAKLIHVSRPVVGTHIERLRTLGLVTMTRDRSGGQTAYELVTTAARVRIPWDVWERVRMTGVMGLAITTMVLAGIETQDEIARHLGTTRKTVNPWMGRLVTAGVLKEITGAARNRKRYAVLPSVVTIIDTN